MTCPWVSYWLLVCPWVVSYWQVMFDKCDLVCPALGQEEGVAD